MAVEYETLVQGGHSKFAEEIFKKVKDKTLIDEVKGIDSVPYHFRQTPYGDRLKEKIIGGTVAWNQIVQNGNFADGTTGWGARGAVVSVSGNTALVTVSSAGTERGLKVSDSSAFQFTAVVGHKYLISAEVNSPITADLLCAFSGINGTRVPVTANTWTRCQALYESPTTVGQLTLYIRQALSQDDVIQYKNVNCFDLTQMFGTAIADYIYNLEQTTAGAGVALFRELFPKDYYEYDAGSLQSVSGLQSHDEVGFNQWDEEWEVGGLVSGVVNSKNFIPVMPNTSYYFKCPNAIDVWEYTEDKQIIAKPSAQNFALTTPNNCKWIKFRCSRNYGTIYNNDICINISDPSKNGQYEPYKKHSYPLDSSLTLRGLFKLDANNHLYADGDRYLPSGQVQHRFNEDMLDGSENWIADSDRTGPNSGVVYHRFYIIKDDMYKPSATTGYIGYMLSTIPTTQDGYVNDDQYTIPISITGYTYAGSISNYLYIIVNSTLSNIEDVAQLKAWLASNHLPVVYELATPTEESAQPYANPQRCAEGGTEEYVTTGIVPVGHESRYVTNRMERFDALPDAVQEDGDYVIRQKNGVMELVDANEKINLRADAISDTVKGAVASFPDGADRINVKDLKVKLSPIQDLHGYDHPWPAGGGKNLANINRFDNLQWDNDTILSNGVTFRRIKNSAGQYIGISANGTATGTAQINVSVPTTNMIDGDILSGSIPGGRIYFENPNSPYTRYGLSDSGSEVPINFNGESPTSAMIILRFFQGANANGTFLPMIRHASESDATFAPYSNICPISGLDEVKVERTGEQYVDFSTAELRPISSSSSTNRVGFEPFLLQAGTYIVEGKSTHPDTIYVVNWQTGDSIITFNTDYAEFTVSSATTVLIRTTYTTVNDFLSNYKDFKCYEKGTKHEVSVDLPETVYSGTLDLETGEVVCDKAMAKVSDLTWSRSYYYFNQSSSLANFIKHVATRSEKSSAITSCYTTIPWDDNDDMSFSVNIDGRLSVTDNRYSTVDDWLSNVANEQIVYELATPVTYHLTPKQLATLKGYNNIWANGNSEVDVEYYADTKLYIEKLTKPTEDDMIANQNIPSGKFFMVGNSLYLSTSAIASGETIIVGTNCTAVSLADALNTLNS